MFKNLFRKRKDNVPDQTVICCKPEYKYDKPLVKVLQEKGKIPKFRVVENLMANGETIRKAQILREFDAAFTYWTDLKSYHNSEADREYFSRNKHSYDSEEEYIDATICRMLESIIVDTKCKEYP